MSNLAVPPPVLPSRAPLLRESCSFKTENILGRHKAKYLQPCKHLPLPLLLQREQFVPMGYSREMTHLGNTW